MKNRLQKTVSLCLTMLLLMSALPFPSAVAEVSDPIPQEETVLVENVESSSVEATPEVNQPTQEPITEQPEQPTEEPTEEETETPQANPASVEPAADPIAAFFGIASIEGNEDFYRALYSYSLGRAGGGMPLTIQLSGSETVTFDGAKHQKIYTAGTITTTVPMPDYYTVTFEAKAVGRIPGTYSQQLSSISVWDSKNNVNMTSFFDPKVTGGGLEITAAGSLLMISADNMEVEFNAFYQELVVTTGQAYINWMPMSDELRLTLRATVEGHPYLPNTYEMDLESYAVEVIEDGTDITEYFEYKFASTGDAVIKPPSDIIWIAPIFDDVKLEYTGYYQDVAVTTETAKIINWNMGDPKPLPEELRVSATGKPMTVTRGSTNALLDEVGGTADYLFSAYIQDMVEFSIEDVESGTDITEYFAPLGGFGGRLFVTPPDEKIQLVFKPEPIVLPYTGFPVNYSQSSMPMYLNGELLDSQLSNFYIVWAIFLDSEKLNLKEPGIYEITEDDWKPYDLLFRWWSCATFSVNEYHDITILPTTLTILAP